MADPTGKTAQELADQRALQEKTTDLYALENRVYAAYGGIGQNAVVPLPNLTATWQTLLFWDTDLIPAPKDVVQDLVNDGIVFNKVGAWSLSTKIELEFIDTTTGRSIQLRFWNATKGQAGTNVFNFGVGRNATSKTLTFSALFALDSLNVGDLWQVQLSSADGFTGVNAIGSTLSAHHVAEELS
jgi:hypothetical protein